jgi:hypothetical protein
MRDKLKNDGEYLEHRATKNILYTVRNRQKMQRVNRQSRVTKQPKYSPHVILITKRLLGNKMQICNPITAGLVL